MSISYTAINMKVGTSNLLIELCLHDINVLIKAHALFNLKLVYANILASDAYLAKSRMCVQCSYSYYSGNFLFVQI